MERYSILLIDDDIAFCKEFTEIFEGKFNLVIHHYRETALQELSKSEFDLILLDLFLESRVKKDGLEILERETRFNQNTPVVIITQLDDSYVSFQTAKYEQVKGYFVKINFDAEQWILDFEEIIRQKYKPNIFISHSSSDKFFVRKLQKRIIPICSNVWVDEGEIGPGENFVSRIEDGLENADYLLLVISEAANDSKWVIDEWTIAKAASNSGHNIKIIPIQLEPCPIPLFLSNLNKIDFSEMYSIFEMKAKDITSSLLLYDFMTQQQNWNSFLFEDAEMVFESGTKRLIRALSS